ncbi:pyruvate kinase, partial [Prescottella equi]
MTRRTKIVCTLGPATASGDRVRELVESGMDVARLNFSHGEHADHQDNYRRVRAASEATGRAVGILADLQGPKIRLGRFVEGKTRWETGEQIRITVEDCEGTHDRVSTTYKQLAQDARPGDRLLVDDGKVGLVVEAVDGDDVVCRVTEGGPVSNNKGVSLPGMNVSVPALSEKDIEDLEFALGLGVDFIALSFVRSPADVELVHDVMDRVGRRVPVIAKLEKPEAIENLEAVVLAFDAVMVARGDLGVELPLEQVPLVQKRAIQIARENAKPVIVATQMLESMIENSRPTRAEASDVANAVLDGADAVM